MEDRFFRHIVYYTLNAASEHFVVFKGPLYGDSLSNFQNHILKCIFYASHAKNQTTSASFLFSPPTFG